MRKRILSALLALCMVLTLLPGTAGAYESQGKCGDHLQWHYDHDTHVLTISGYGDMYDYSGSIYGNHAAPWGRSVETAYIQNGVTSIGEYAFANSRLTSISLPDSITLIKPSAFASCSLTDITIPSSVTEIGAWAFSSCGQLTRAVISDSLTQINRGVFHGCSHLTDIVIPSSVTDIGESAFDGCGLTNVTIPDSVTCIERMAFSGCKNLTSITIPSSITQVEELVFWNCTGLTDVILPNTITSIGEAAFQKCRNLSNINIPDSVTRIDKGAFYGCENLTSISIPDSLTEIANDTFFDCTGLVTVDLPTSIVNIGDRAFYGCTNLKELHIPDSVIKVGWSAFGNCTALTKITIPGSITQFGTYGSPALFGCSGLTSAGPIGGGYDCEFGWTEVIPEGGFRSCDGLTSVTIPNSITSIGRSVFDYCTNLTNIIVEAGNSTYASDNGTLYNKDKTTLIRCPGGTAGSYHIPAGVNRITETAFNNCEAITSITIPNSVKKIDGNAFNGCSALSSVILPNDISEIEYGLFSWCHSLSSISIPDSVSRINGRAFYDCTSLKSIVIPDSVSSIGSDSFRACDSLTDIYYSGNEEEWAAVEIDKGNDPLLNATIHYNSLGPGMGGVGEDPKPDHLAWNYDEASKTLTISGSGKMPNYTEDSHAPWSGCSDDAASIVIENGITSVGDYAFEFFLNAAEVKIPEGVTSIGKSAFQTCGSLTSVEIPEGVTRIGEEAFGGCISLKSVSIPRSMTDIGEFAFQILHELDDVYYGGTKSEWESIHVSPGNTPLLTAKNIHYKGEEAPQKPLPFYSAIGNHTTEIDIGWSWDLFDLPTTVYDSRLAALGATLSSAAENSKERTIALLNELGFDQTSPHNYEVNGVFSPGVVFGYKRVIRGNEPDEHIFVVAVSGTRNEGIGDKISDILAFLGQGIGFTASTGHVAYDFGKFISSCGLDPHAVKTNGKIFVTGHSLGGAVANLLSAKLNDEYGRENVFGYTFAPPLTAPSSTTIGAIPSIWNLLNGQNVNIHNIINAEDVVPKVGSGYAFTRYGQNYPAFHRDALASQGFYDNYKMLVGKSYAEVNEDIFKAHAIEVYMSYVLTASSLKPVGQKKDYVVVRIACPVDVEVYTSEGQLAGRVVDGQVSDTIPEKTYIYLENDEKYVILADNDDYTINLLGTGDGTMEYSVHEIDIDTGEAVAEKAFEKVALTDGKQFISYVSVWDKADASIDTEDKIDTPDVPLYVLDSDGEPEKEVLPDGEGTEVPVTPPDEPDVPDKPETPDKPDQPDKPDKPTYPVYPVYPDYPSYPSYPNTTTKPSTTTPSVKPEEPKQPAVPETPDEPEIPDEPAPTPLPFTDVPSGAYYYDAVRWAVEQGITTGTSATAFGPDLPCNRAQVVTFLWRAAGSPAPQGSTALPFTDVPSGAYYYDAVLWAVEQGITAGTSATAFSPDAAVTRSQAVTFLYRAASSPTTGGSSSFADVDSGAYYADAVRWAVTQGITNGTSAAAFSPDTPCTRAQIVTFLYRAK